MKPSTNTSISNWILLATTISTSVLSLAYDPSTDIIPEVQSKTDIPTQNLSDWIDNAFDLPSDYTLTAEYSHKVETLINFSKKVVDNTIDIDNEYVEIVNDNFWDLI